jgi:hypothetical protein
MGSSEGQGSTLLAGLVAVVIGGVLAVSIAVTLVNVLESPRPAAVFQAGSGQPPVPIEFGGDDRLIVVTLPLSVIPPDSYTCRSDDQAQKLICLAPEDEVEGTALAPVEPTSTATATPRPTVTPVPLSAPAPSSLPIWLAATGTFIAGIAAAVGAMVAWRNKPATRRRRRASSRSGKNGGGTRGR